MEINVNNTFFTGKFLVHLPSVDSTNNYAKQHLAKNSPIDGTVILADEQYAGRGQSGNIWQSVANKNLTFSIIYQTSFLLATEQYYLNMAISLGIKYAVSSMLSMQYIDRNRLQPTQELPTCKIKWPNDILVENRKIAGILIENTISGLYLKHSIIGIGLNVNQEDFQDGINATSLRNETKLHLDRSIALNKVLVSIEKYFFMLRERKFEQLKREYLENLYRYKVIAEFMKGEQVFLGTITDVDDIGNLMIETTNGIEKFGFKEIRFVI